MRALALLLVVLVVVGCGAATGHSHARVAQAPAVRHVFTIVLENEDYATTFGRRSATPYLARTLPRKGALLPGYFGIAHASLPNYLAMVAGVQPTPTTRRDCPRFDCTYGADVPTFPGQLEAAGRTWRAYAQDVPAPCPVPVDGHGDPFEQATRSSQFATRHVPFLYFHSLTDRRADCRRRVVGLGALQRDLRSVATTPDWSFITPDLCADGHDAVCADPRRPGGHAGVEAFLREWVPRILASPAFRQDGLLVVTFDEAEDDAAHGGGRVGAVLVGRGVRPGTVDRTLLTHDSYLRSMEDLFGLQHLGRAAAEGVATFQSAGVLAP